jgi:5-methylcytosine-specific restriction endonuclease McrA
MAYDSSRWKSARSAALARDNNQCQACGTKRTLHVHHIKPVAEFDHEEDTHYLENLVIEEYPERFRSGDNQPQD